MTIRSQIMKFLHLYYFHISTHISSMYGNKLPPHLHIFPHSCHYLNCFSSPHLTSFLYENYTVLASFSAHISKNEDFDKMVTMIMILTIIIPLKLFQTQLFLPFNTLAHHIRKCFKI